MGKTIRKQFGIKFIEGNRKAHKKLKYNQKHQLMFGENSIKLNKFIDLTIEYHTDWNFCSRTFREFCVGGVS